MIEISTNELGTDEILIRIASDDPTEDLLNQIKDHFRAKLRVSPKVEFISQDIINKIIFAPMSRKPITFIDKRT